MARLSFFFLVVLVMLALALLSCGTGRMLLSISVSPAAADAHDFPDGLVRFTATGTFNKAPLTVTPLPVKWFIGNPFSLAPIPGGVSIDDSGVAHCTTFVGTTLISAVAPADPTKPLPDQVSTNPADTKQFVMGTAQLTCP